MGSNTTHRGHKPVPGLLKSLREIERRATKGRRRKHRISRRAAKRFQKHLLECIDCCLD